MLKRRSIDPIRTVSVRDPAINHELSRMPEFVRTRNLDLLVFTPAGPTYFEAKRLSQAARLVCDGTPGEMRWRWAFLSGVTKVDHPEWVPRFQTIAGGEKILADASLETIDDEIVDEIGHWVYQESRLYDPRKGRFSLPPGSDAPIAPSRWDAPSTADTPIGTSQSNGATISVVAPSQTSSPGEAIQTSSTPTFSDAIASTGGPTSLASEISSS